MWIYYLAGAADKERRGWCLSQEIIKNLTKLEILYVAN